MMMVFASIDVETTVLRLSLMGFTWTIDMLFHTIDHYCYATKLTSMLNIATNQGPLSIYLNTRSIKYLFKYINKGNDRVSATFYKQRRDQDDPDAKDEICDYIECRYVSPCDGAWRIFGFVIMLREPSVERLPFHLPNQQPVIFQDDDPIDYVLDRNEGIGNKFLNKSIPNTRSKWLNGSCFKF